LVDDGESLGAGEDSVSRLSALDGRVFVDPEHRLLGKRLTDNSNAAGLEHDN
jgi:hypothetical protein